MLRRARTPDEGRGAWLRLPVRDAADPVVKPAAYLPIYEELLAPLRDCAFALLELGVWSGDSLQMWRDAFPQVTVIGVDLGPPELKLGERVHVARGDQADADLLGRLRAKHALEGFAVIIDDASHLGVTSARSLQALYREHLRPGGLYCIEDWGTGYMPDWDDGGVLAAPLDVGALDGVAGSAAADGTPTRSMPSHDAGLVGLIKRLIDHTAGGTVVFAQPEAARDVLAIESMMVWDGIVALRKPRTQATP